MTAPPPSDRDAILDILATCSKEDFDGHTEFHRLTAKERILWLSHTAYFVHRVAKNNPHLGCHGLFISSQDPHENTRP